MVVARERLGAGIPREGGSAKLTNEGTYFDEIQMLCWLKSKVIRCKTVFCAGLLDFPPSIA